MRKLSFLFAFFLSVMGVTQAWSKTYSVSEIFGSGSNWKTTSSRWNSFNPYDYNSNDINVVCYYDYADNPTTTADIISPLISGDSKYGKTVTVSGWNNGGSSSVLKVYFTKDLSDESKWVEAADLSDGMNKTSYAVISNFDAKFVIKGDYYIVVRVLKVALTSISIEDNFDADLDHEKTIYLQTNLASGRYAAYMWNENGSKWADFSLTAEKTTTYKATVDADYGMIILVCMNPSSTENNWNNKWYQTANIVPAVNNALYYFKHDETYTESTYSTPVPINIYLNANGWQNDNAKLTAWTWGNRFNDQWVDLTAVEGEEGIYTAALPEGTTGLKFVRKAQGSDYGWGTTDGNPNWNESGDAPAPYEGILYSMTDVKNDVVPTTSIYSLELNETDETSQVKTGDIYKMTVAFTVAADKFAALCLPFATTATELGVKAWAFNGYDGNISLTTTDNLEAGKPYVVYAANGVNGFNFQNVTIASNEAGSVQQGDATFKGTYVTMAAGTLTGMYGVTPTGKIQKAGANASMKAFRGYFDGISSSAKVYFDGQEATGIEAAEVLNAITGEMYDLSGRRVNNAQKGIYIQNGKKIVVK